MKLQFSAALVAIGLRDTNDIHVLRLTGESRLAVDFHARTEIARGFAGFFGQADAVRVTFEAGEPAPTEADPEKIDATRLARNVETMARTVETVAHLLTENGKSLSAETLTSVWGRLQSAISAPLSASDTLNERATIVAWLRETSKHPCHSSVSADALLVAAGDIESGCHRKVST